MIKIAKGLTVIEVTRGAYESIYCHQGYKPVEDAEYKEMQEPEHNIKKSDDELFTDEIVTKPIAQWTKDEVKRFAAIHELDISGTKSAAEAKDIIKAFLSESEEF